MSAEEAMRASVAGNLPDYDVKEVPEKYRARNNAGNLRSERGLEHVRTGYESGLTREGHCVSCDSVVAPPGADCLAAIRGAEQVRCTLDLLLRFFKGT
jgi:hypothetical protein